MRVRRVPENQFINSEEGVDIGLIVITEALLLLYGISLVVEILLGNFQRAHAVAFEPERQGQMACRQRFVVIGPLSRSCAVHGPAGVEDVLEMRGFGYVF